LYQVQISIGTWYKVSMFTGIVERLGKVIAVRERAGGGRELSISPLPAGGAPPWKAAVLGESISVSGVCLTASRLARGGREVSFDAVPETISRTTLGRLHPGDRVNLERSLAVGDRIGGHFVTGHIDGTGEVLGRDEVGTGVLFRIAAPDPVLSLLIPKGSVAVDGISLTVVEVDRRAGRFSFAAIPHTLKWTTLGERRPGHAVNLEADPLGKYVLHAVREVLEDGPSRPRARR
jgi:riboflavin synthase